MRNREKIKSETLKSHLGKNEVLILEVLLDVRELLEALVKEKTISLLNELKDSIGSSSGAPTN